MSVGTRAKFLLVRGGLTVIDAIPARPLLTLVAALRRLPGAPTAALRSVAKRVNSRLAVLDAAPALGAPLQVDTVLYEAYLGASVTCHPEAIFRHLLGDSAYRHLRHVWVLATADGTTEVEREFVDEPRVRFVRHRSREYFEALHTSKFLVNNSTFPADFTKRAGQVYLNTWHGVPLKKMGFDLPGGAANSGNVTRNHLSADYLVSSSTAETRKLWAEAFRLDGLYGGTILETGSPRVDVELDHTRALSTRARLAAHGITLGTGPVIVYAPTWRGTFSETPDVDIDAMVSAAHSLQAALADIDGTVLLRVHQFVFPYVARDRRLVGLVVPPETGANELLAIADLLITDYSSIFFDYLALDRPICFYAPDLQRYTRTRGVYIPTDEWPGPLSETVDDLIGRVREALDDDPFAARRRSWAEIWSLHQDGNATRRVVDAVFGGATPNHAVSLAGTRPRVLILAGGRLSRRTRADLTRLVAALGSQNCDVTVYVRPGGAAGLSADVAEHARVIEGVRPLVRVPSGSEAWHAFGGQRFEAVVARKSGRGERALFEQVSAGRRLAWQRGQVPPALGNLPRPGEN